MAVISKIRTDAKTNSLDDQLLVHLYSYSFWKRLIGSFYVMNSAPTSLLTDNYVTLVYISYVFNPYQFFLAGFRWKSSY